MVKFLLKFIKGETYLIDSNVSTLDFSIIIINRLIMLLRGLFFRVSIKGRGLIFIGKNVYISHKHKIKFGKNVTIKDNSAIIGLVKSKIIIGHNFTLGTNSLIEGYGVLNEIGESLIIGENVGIGSHSFIAIRGKIEIGSNTIFGPGLKIHPESHNFSNKDLLIRKQGTKRKGIQIGSNCWIGSNVTILDGVVIEDGAVIGANSLVNKDVGKNEIHFGVRIKFFKNRLL
jgi:acetyltransferase-like isoleucine patch superfamily enzyme